MIAKNEFDQEAKIVFLESLAKEANVTINSSDDWTNTIRDLLTAPEILLSSDALQILITIYEAFLLALKESTPTSDDLPAYKLGNLISA